MALRVKVLIINALVLFLVMILAEYLSKEFIVTLDDIKPVWKLIVSSFATIYFHVIALFIVIIITFLGTILSIIFKKKELLNAFLLCLGINVFFVILLYFIFW